MNRRRQTTFGFTLVEIMVSITVFMIIGTVGLLSFRSSNQTSQLKDAGSLLASNIRKAIGNTRAGNTVEGKAPRAFGLSFNKHDPTFYLEYADMIPSSTPPDPDDYEYTPGVDAFIDQVNFHDVNITDIVLTSSGQTAIPDRADIVFMLPSAVFRVRQQRPGNPIANYPNDYITLTITLKHTKSGRTKTIEVIGGPLGATVIEGEVSGGSPAPLPPPTRPPASRY